MKVKLIFFLLIAFCMHACKTNRKQKQATEPKPSMNFQSTPNGGDVSTITGQIKNLIDKEPVEFAKVFLIQNEKLVSGVITDLDGKFQINRLASGQYLIKIEANGFKSFEMPYIIKQSSTIKVEILLEQRIEQVEKPVIYFYPTEKQEISVKLNYKGELTHSYPAYPENGWKVTAEPNGTLWDSKGQEYYALFWEGKANKQIMPKDGFVVSSKTTAAFLEEKLSYLGLSRREANEFIMYWLPRMENNPYNFIHFAGIEYEDLAELKITPKPETCIRVMMLTQALPSPIDFPLQDLTTMKKIRKGFTVVEWGGSIIQLSDL